MIVVDVGLPKVGDFGVFPSFGGLSCCVWQFGCSVSMNVISELMGCDGIVAKMKVGIPKNLAAPRPGSTAIEAASEIGDFLCRPQF